MRGGGGGHKLASHHTNVCKFVELYLHLRKGAVSQNSAKLGNYKMPIKFRET